MRLYRSLDPGKPPKSNSTGTARSMKSNTSSGTRPELILSKLLRKKILKNSLPGSPDFVYPRKKVAVFLHGCFWHRCPHCNFEPPRRNRDFWSRKFERNVERDKLVNQELETMGWRVVEVWEHELRKDPIKVAERIVNFNKVVVSQNVGV